MIIGTPGQRRKVQFNNINICEANISASDKAQNLGVLFDRELNLNLQVNDICKFGFFHVRSLSSICNMLHKDSATMAAHAFVTSTLDYCNSLLYGLPKKKICKIQLVQNAAARVVINAQISDRISMTAVRKVLHWLPINARIEFKMLMLTWKAYIQIGPDFLVELLKKQGNRH